MQPFPDIEDRPKDHKRIKNQYRTSVLAGRYDLSVFEKALQALENAAVNKLHLVISVEQALKQGQASAEERQLAYIRELFIYHDVLYLLKDNRGSILDVRRGKQVLKKAAEKYDLKVRSANGRSNRAKRLWDECYKPKTKPQNKENGTIGGAVQDADAALDLLAGELGDTAQVIDSCETAINQAHSDTIAAQDLLEPDDDILLDTRRQLLEAITLLGQSKETLEDREANLAYIEDELLQTIETRLETIEIQLKALRGERAKLKQLRANFSAE